MNKYLICLIIVVMLVSTYYLFKSDEKLDEPKKTVVKEVRDSDYNYFVKHFMKNVDDFDTQIAYINAKTLAKLGDEKSLKDFLKS